MKKWYFLLPFLYGIAPVVALFANNSGQALASEMVLPIIIVSAATLVLLPPCRFLTGSWLRGAVLLSLVWLIFFAYGHLARLIGRHPVAGHNPGNFKFLLPVAFVLGLLIARGLRRARSEPAKLAGVLGVFVTALMLTSVVTIVRYQSTVRAAPVEAVLPEEPIVPSQTVRKPDIYYFILDRYAAERTLRARYDTDNSAFLDSLRSDGFYIAGNSRANYLVTAQSLASSLNMAHILPLGQEIGPVSMDWEPVFDLIAKNRLARFLKAEGYRYIHIGPEWEPTASNPQADASYSYRGIPEFTMMLLTTTAVYPVLYQMGINNMDLKKFEGVTKQLNMIPELARKEPSPKFFFVHMLLPHGPYVFNRDGTYRRPEVSGAHTEAENFKEQVIFISNRMVELVRDIQDGYGADDQPVIVIQGDEGPYPTRTQPHEFDWTKATDEEINEKMRILNAIYAPGCESDFHETMTPVNTFRIVLNHYFGTGLSMLPDRSFAYRDLQHLYDFVEVTDRLDQYRD